MTELLHCVCYMALLGIACFPFGRLLALCPLRGDLFPFAPLPFEKNGKVYEKLRIRKWQKRVPDVSRVMGRIVPKKALCGMPDGDKLARMVKETCVAELTHFVLCLLGLYLPVLMPGAGGVVLCAAYIVLGNLPFVLIQRYNRPRLLRLLAAAERKEKEKSHEGADTELQ